MWVVVSAVGRENQEQDAELGFGEAELRRISLARGLPGQKSDTKVRDGTEIPPSSG